MSTTNLDIQRFKKNSATEALLISIPIKNLDERIIGKLVPIGNWALSEKLIIESFVNWRSKTQKMFPTQTKVTCETTIDYLKSSSVDNPNGILFLIYDEVDNLVGHIGVTRLNSDPFELVNLMRGVSGGDPRLIYFAEVTLLDWCFKLKVSDKAIVEVMSYNWMVISLHEEVGFVISETLPLRKVESEFGIFHEVVNVNESNVKYSILKLSLSCESFYEKAQSRK